MFRQTKSLWPAIKRSIYQIKPIRQSILSATHYKSKLTTNKLFYTTVISEPTIKILHWSKYRELIENSNEKIPAKELEALSKFTVSSKTIKPSVAISRIQDILKYMSTRQDNPDVKASFRTCCNHLIQAYIQQGDLKTARLVFDKMVAVGDVNEESIRQVANGIRSLGTRAEIYEFQKSMESRGLWVDSSLLYNSIIYALRDFGDLPGCRYYFTEMKKKNLANTVHAYRAIMSVYRKANQPNQVLKYFNEMKEEGLEPTAGEYGILFGSLSKDKNYHTLLKDVFEEMKSKKQPINLSFFLYMGWDPLEAMKEMDKTNLNVSVRDCNSGLAYYVKKNQFPEALDVMKWMNEYKIKMDTFSYSIMIDALAKDYSTPPMVVFNLYEDMKRHKLIPDQVTFTSLITNCCKNQDLDKALTLLNEMQIYEIKPNTYTFNSVLNVLSSMTETSSVDVERASLVWSQMTDLGIQPDTRTCNIYLSLISRLIKSVQLQNNEPERYSQTTLWEELEDTSRRVPQTVKEMQRMYRYMRRHKLESMKPDFVTYSIVINAMSAAGEVRSAMQVYDDAKMSRVTLPVPAYNEMMSALQRCGRVSESMGIWHDMKLQSILPDNTTYSIVLENCEQLGLIESIESIRRQRKLDFDRLQELEKKKEMRKLERSLKR